MEAVRQIIDSQLLNGVVPLPGYFRDKKVEIIVMPIEEASAPEALSQSELEGLLKGSIAESLIGAIPDSGRGLAGYRAERLAKYGRSD